MGQQASAPTSDFRPCPDCGRAIPTWQRRHRARDRPGYSELWAGDVRVKLFGALRAYRPGGGGRVRMVTVTGQGSEGLPWDDAHCAHLGEHRHSGQLGCRVDPAASAAYNDAAPSWWSELHRQARTAACRRTRSAPVLLVRIWELQKRGVLHLHLVVGYSTPVERAAVDAYVQELSARSARHGFGFVDRKVDVKQPTQAAAYLSSYFVAGKKGKMTLRETVTAAGMPRSIVYVAPALSQASGLTMRSLRLRRYAWRLWRTVIEPAGLDLEVGPGDIWQGLQQGKTLAAVVTSCLDPA